MVSDETIQMLMALRRDGVSDPDVLRAMETTPRELFVNEDTLGDAYENRPLPIDCGQTISQPSIVAIMAEALELSPKLRVLEVGSGSGYFAAVLSKLCRMVYGIERYEDLYRQAKHRIESLGLRNVQLRCGNGMKGWPEAAPFDRIVLSAAPEQVPPLLFDQLVDGGMLLAPVGAQGEAQWLVRHRKQGSEISEERLLPVSFVPLVA